MDPKYHYRAKAVAFSGSFTRPLAIDLGELAKTELVNGESGYFSNRVDGHRFHEILSVGPIYTQITANEGPDGHFNTLASATIENLNILDIVKVERITARMVALHRQADFAETDRPWMIPLGSIIENMRVAGRSFEVKHPPGFVHDFDKPHSYDEWKKNQQHCLNPGSSFHLPGFGTVSYCKLEAVPFATGKSGKTHHLHRLTMLALDMGSPVHGSLRFGACDIDGNPPHEDDL